MFFMMKKIFLYFTFFMTTNSFIKQQPSLKDTFRLKNTFILNNSNTSHFNLYSPPLLVPLVPYSVAKSLLLQKYLNELKNNNDIGIFQCEQFRKYMYTLHKNNIFPKPRLGMIGDDYIVGFLKIEKSGTNVIMLENILPLNNKNMYNITTMMRLFHIQYKPCSVNTSNLSKYWQKVFNLYKAY